jgi:hypothetical protein
MMATMLTLAGFTAGYYTSSETAPESRTVSAAVPAASTAPRITAPVVVPPVQTSAQNDVAATVQEETPAVQAVSRPAERKAGVARPVVASPARANVSSTSDPAEVKSSQSGSATTTDPGNEPSHSSVDNTDPSMQVELKIKKSSDTNSNQSESSKETP